MFALLRGIIQPGLGEVKLRGYAQTNPCTDSREGRYSFDRYRGLIVEYLDQHARWSNTEASIDA